MSTNNDNKCSFCGKYEFEVDKLIAGPSKTFICDCCVSVCNNMISEIKSELIPVKREGKVLLTPEKLKEKLDEYIIGQDDAKRVLSVAVYNHYKRINFNGESKGKKQAKNMDDVELEKSNVLMLGPTGSGKTLIARTLAKILNVPFAVSDATTLTQAGYVGEDVENILLRLIQEANGDIARAEMGIIYIDEIDKLARKTGNVSITRDVSGEGVQQALLKIIESTVSNVPPEGGRKHPSMEYLQINTTNILFIVGGAFVGLEQIVKDRSSVSSIGFSGTVKSKNSTVDYLKDVQPHDLVKFGLIPEFVGRIPIVVSLNELDEQALVNILTKPKNAIIKQYEYMVSLDGAELVFEEEALLEIARKAIELKTGARGLRSVVEGIMLDHMYMLPSDPSIRKITITKDTVINGVPIIERAKEVG